MTKKLKEKVVDIKRLGERLVGIQFVLGKETLNIISVYMV